MKKIINKLIIVIVVIIVTIIALVPINKNYESVNWMKQLDDKTLINEMVIPGSHDSGAMHSIFDVAGKCQDLSIKKQLKIGVRFLDIRLRLKNNELEVVHSFVEQKISFKSVLEDISYYISNNKSEFLRAKEMKHHKAMALYDCLKFVNQAVFTVFVIGISTYLATQNIISVGSVLTAYLCFTQLLPIHQL